MVQVWNAYTVYLIPVHDSIKTIVYRLFTNVYEAYYLHRPTYEAFINLLDNYNHRVGSAEITSYVESKEVDAFLSEISKTSVMQKTLTFLQQKGMVWGAMVVSNKFFFFIS